MIAAHFAATESPSTSCTFDLAERHPSANFAAQNQLTVLK
jgi:hypothetical protein